MLQLEHSLKYLILEFFSIEFWLTLIRRTELTCHLNTAFPWQSSTKKRGMY